MQDIIGSRKELAEGHGDASVVEWLRRSEVIDESRGRVCGAGRFMRAQMQLAERFQLQQYGAYYRYQLQLAYT